MYFVSESITRSIVPYSRMNLSAREGPTFRIRREKSVPRRRAKSMKAGWESWRVVRTSAPETMERAELRLVRFRIRGAP
jgi:hypothetical protein